MIHFLNKTPAFSRGIEQISLKTVEHFQAVADAKIPGCTGNGPDIADTAPPVAFLIQQL